MGGCVGGFLTAHGHMGSTFLGLRGKDVVAVVLSLVLKLKPFTFTYQWKVCKYSPSDVLI